MQFLTAQAASPSIEQMINDAVELWDVPGISVGIIHDGSVLYSDGAGTMEAGTDKVPDGNTKYAIASNTKAFLSAAVAMLIEDGKLGWSDPVQQYLPGFAMYDPCVSEMVMIEDLLCHRAGLGTYSGDVIWYKSELPASEVVKRIKYVPQAYDFRAGYGYSNLMFITAGEVIRAVTGKAWDQYLEKKVFDPLGMSQTVTSTNKLPAMTNVATPHKPVDGQHVAIPWVNWDNMGAAGGIISCTDDMLKWLGMQLNQGIHGTDTLFSRQSQINMWTLHNVRTVSDGASRVFRDRNFNGYGLGWGIADYAGRKIVSHGGGYDGMYSRVVMVPSENLGIVILTNGMTGIATPLSYQLIDHILGLEAIDWHRQYKGFSERNEKNRDARIEKIMEARKEDTSPCCPASAFTGTYADPMYGEIEVREESGKLRLIFTHAPDLNATLTHWHYNTYAIEWDEVHAWFGFGTVQFLTDNNGKPVELQFDVPNEDIFFDEIHAVRKD